MISLKNISKSYGSQLVLNDISCVFDSGKVYGIVGENGAGKTTLFRCIAGLESHSGEAMCKFNILKDHLGYLQTEPYFIDKMTGKEYVQLLCYARAVVCTDLDSKNIFDLPLDKYASTYSTGMKKKLSILGILMQENDLFIFDEPYNGVDIQSNILISEIIHTLRKLNKTILISSHIFSTLIDVCDEIFLMQKGEFTKQVKQGEFQALEAEMKRVLISDKIEKLGLK
jgi:ABC-2 type transport system ATP-binding protein